MLFPGTPTDAAILATLLLPFLTSATVITCDRIRVKNTSFDLHKLGGPRSVMHSIDHGGASFTNTTYTIDICDFMKPPKDGKKGEYCPNGTRVCAIERFIKGKEINEIQDAFPIAGDLKGSGGKDMDPKWMLLKHSTSHDDSQKDGLSLELFGGFNEVEGKPKAQKAIVEFLCDKREGTEHLYEPEDKETKPAKRAEEGDQKDEEDDKSPSLEFVRYEESDPEINVLRLKWRTKYACEGAKDDQDAEPSAHWGFFTWFILIAFLGTATYLIFGSWLNYNRYGARGWDLLPHGDAIRDVPYLMKDWSRRVMNTVQGGGSRGGYAAV